MFSNPTVISLFENPDPHINLAISLLLTSEEIGVFRREYMESTLWEDKKKQRLKLDEYCCQRCGDNYRLEVHHWTYEHFAQEPMEDLGTLCHRCHWLYHNYDFFKNVSRADFLNWEDYFKSPYPRKMRWD